MQRAFLLLVVLLSLSPPPSGAVPELHPAPWDDCHTVDRLGLRAGVLARSGCPPTADSCVLLVWNPLWNRSSSRLWAECSDPTKGLPLAPQLVHLIPRPGQACAAGTGLVGETYVPPPPPATCAPLRPTPGWGPRCLRRPRWESRAV